MCEGVSLTLTKERPINRPPHGPLQMEMTIDLIALEVRRLARISAVS